MFYYVSLEQNNTSTLGASNAQQEHVNSINIIGEKTWKIQKTSINSPKFQINLKDKKKGSYREELLPSGKQGKFCLKMCEIIEPMCEKWALNSNLMAKVGFLPSV